MLLSRGTLQQMTLKEQASSFMLELVHLALSEKSKYHQNIHTHNFNPSSDVHNILE